MHQVQFELNDHLYEQAKRRAVAAGCNTVGEYIAGIVSVGLADDVEDLERLFTPGRIAHIDSVIAKVKAGGKTYTPDEVREHFRKRFEE